MLILKEKERLQSQIKALRQSLDQLKKSIHSTEVNILLEDTAELQAGVPDYRLIAELQEINKKKHILRDTEKELKDTTLKYDTINRTIEHYEYWMRRADTHDIARQKEAEKVIFG